MSIDVQVRNKQRLVLVRFERAVAGNPTMDTPDPDERGYGAPERGPVVGVGVGRTVRVKLRRGSIDHSAPLFVSSSQLPVATVTPGPAALPAVAETEIQITGVDGGANFRRCTIDVRFGDATTGPVVGRLHVRVFRPLDVDLTPHVVTIAGPGGAGPVAPIANVPNIMTLLRAVWIHYGITFTVHPVQAKTISLAAAGIVSDTPFPNELRTILSNNWPDGTPNWIPRTINVYFVPQIGTGNTLGYGFSRSSFGGFGLPNPGILVGDRTAGGGRSGDMHWGNDIAHEVGHFFQLWHPEQKQPPNEREDTWSRRALMHNFNLMRGPAPWPANDGSGTPYQFRPRFSDVGYGASRRGCFVSIKDLPQLTGDGETDVARGTILSAAGPY